MADSMEAQAEYGIELCAWEDLKNCQALILAVPHAHYLELSVEDFGAMMVEDATLVDIKSVLDRGELDHAKLNVWRM